MNKKKQKAHNALAARLRIVERQLADDGSDRVASNSCDLVSVEVPALVADRVAVVAPVLATQAQAGLHGKPCHRPRALVNRDTNTKYAAAKHFFPRRDERPWSTYSANELRQKLRTRRSISENVDSAMHKKRCAIRGAAAAARANQLCAAGDITRTTADCETITDPPRDTELALRLEAKLDCLWWKLENLVAGPSYKDVCEHGGEVIGLLPMTASLECDTFQAEQLNEVVESLELSPGGPFLEYPPPVKNNEARHKWYHVKHVDTQRSTSIGVQINCEEPEGESNLAYDVLQAQIRHQSQQLVEMGDALHSLHCHLKGASYLDALRVDLSEQLDKQCTSIRDVCGSCFQTLVTHFKAMPEVGLERQFSSIGSLSMQLTAIETRMPEHFESLESHILNGFSNRFATLLDERCDDLYNRVAESVKKASTMAMQRHAYLHEVLNDMNRKR